MAWTASADGHSDRPADPLTTAAEANDAATVKRLLRDPRNKVIGQRASSMLAHSAAADPGALQVLQALLRFGQSFLGVRDQHGETPLHAAVRAANLPAVESILASPIGATLVKLTSCKTNLSPFQLALQQYQDAVPALKDAYWKCYTLLSDAENTPRKSNAAQLVLGRRRPVLPPSCPPQPAKSHVASTVGAGLVKHAKPRSEQLEMKKPTQKFATRSVLSRLGQRPVSRVGVTVAHSGFDCRSLLNRRRNLNQVDKEEERVDFYEITD